MIILGADTSVAGRLLLCLDADNTAIQRSLDVSGLEEEFISSVQQLLNDAQINITDVDRFVIGSGPGSFMGLRIGYSVFKAWAWANKRPLAEISSLEIFARSFDGMVAPSIDAKMGKVFCAIFDNGLRLIADSDLTPKEYEELLQSHPLARPMGFLGNGEMASAEGLLAAARALPQDSWLSGKDLLSAQPRYLRLSAAEEARLAINSKKN
ncbi:MAG: tRNA (adenosine(37)-N6)-threonylcarbamoyltransferase complex dimerization subunit type 1 TsaB [Brevinema sp.]